MPTYARPTRAPRGSASATHTTPGAARTVPGTATHTTTTRPTSPPPAPGTPVLNTPPQKVDWMKRIDKMVREGTLVLDHIDEDGRKVYKRGDPESWKKEWLIDGVPRTHFTEEEQQRVLAKWKADGMAGETIED